MMLHRADLFLAIIEDIQRFIDGALFMNDMLQRVNHCDWLIGLPHVSAIGDSPGADIDRVPGHLEHVFDIR